MAKRSNSQQPAANRQQAEAKNEQPAADSQQAAPPAAANDDKAANPKQVVQLTGNVGDRQIGETMTRAEAAERNIPDSYLRPFDRQTDRMMRPGNVEQH